MIRTAIVCLLLLAASHSQYGLAGETLSLSYFRRDSGVASDGRPLADRFDAENLVWRTAMLPGISTPCVVGDRIFVTTFDAQRQELATVALDRGKGSVLWRRVAPTSQIEPVHSVGSPAASTPACDGERVYAFFGSYGILCYDLEGNPQWEHRMGPFQDEFGASSSPVLAGDLVILNEDHDIDSFLIAIDKHTGRTVWRTARDGFTRSYSTPVIWESDGKRQVVVAGALQLAAYDLATGEKAWWINGLSRIVDTTPVLADGRIYLATWTPGGDPTERIAMEPFPETLTRYDASRNGRIEKGELSEGPVLERFFRIDLDQDGSLDQAEWKAHSRVFELAQNVAMAIRPGGQGDVTAQRVEWTGRRGLPVVPSPLVYQGTLYMVKSGGIFTAVDAATGELLHEGRAAGRGNYYASLVAGDGKIYLASEPGIVSILQAGKPWKAIASHDFGERILATPVLADGSIYLRTDEAVYCFDRR